MLSITVQEQDNVKHTIMFRFPYIPNIRLICEDKGPLLMPLTVKLQQKTARFRRLSVSPDRSGKLSV